MKQIVLGFILLSSVSLKAQMVDENEADESKFYIQTKQVNQFFRRFNGEENEKGKRYYEDDRRYRNEKLRENYLSILFDNSNTGISNRLRSDFVEDIVENDPDFLNFHEKGFFAEVNTKFLYRGKKENLLLYLKLEQENLGYKWVIEKVHFDPFLETFETDSSQKFLHPMSHELYFLNLKKVFDNPDQAVKYADKDWRPDQLTLFLQEVKKGNLRFTTVNDVKFHFFQIPGWYFEVSEFKRPGMNTGWLISNLVKLNSANDKELMQRYIYHEVQ